MIYTWGIKVEYTHIYRLGRRIDGRDNTKHAESNVCSLLLPGARTCLVMKHRRINVTERYATRRRDGQLWLAAFSGSATSYQAKLPTNATNLSRSFAPAQLSAVQPITTKNLNVFFCHLTFQSSFPLRVKRPFSMIRTAGKSWSGTESRIASE